MKSKKISKARKSALENYSRAVKNFNAKMKRLQGKSNIDYTMWFSKPQSLKEVRNLSTSDIKVLIRDLKSFTDRGGEKIIKYNNQFLPKAYKEQYQRSIRRYNRNQKRLDKYQLNKIKKPDNDKVGTFLEFSKKVIQKSSPLYWQKRSWQYKKNYLKAVKDALGHTTKGKKLEKLIESLDADRLISAYYKKGNEDLGINYIYPGDEDQAEETADYIIERWIQEYPELSNEKLVLR